VNIIAVQKLNVYVKKLECPARMGEEEWPCGLELR
jgi:hypothetical protein